MQGRRSQWDRAWLLGAVLVTWLPLAATTSAQQSTAAKSQASSDDPTRDPGEQRFPGGAALKIDLDQQRILKRADECVSEGRLDLAVVLWQKVLDEAGDTLMTRDGRTYASLAEQVEQTIVKLPRQALETYRASADGDAQALLAAAGAEGEEQALAQIVRRFFLSSQGDDAAYKLACLALDRHDFVAASRMLTKILDNHPDPSTPKAQILLRLAVAAAHMGDRQAAEQALTRLAATEGPRPTAGVVDLVSADVKAASGIAASRTGPGSKDWHLSLGNAARAGHMLGLPTDATSRTLTELWSHEFEFATAEKTSQADSPRGAAMAAAGAAPVVMLSSRAANPNLQTTPLSRQELIAQWRAGGWRPAGHLLFDNGRVYLKTPNRLISYGAQAPGGGPLWQSAWETRYELDGISQQLAMMAQQMGWNLPQSSQARPKTAHEIFLFGDRVHQSMALADGVIYSLEGRRVPASAAAPAAAARVQWNVTPRRTRSNWLSAYQADGGKAVWTRAASDNEPETTGGAGFLSAPVPTGTLLLAPITDGGTIWLLGLDRASGKTIWKTYLCDEPPGGASPWAEVVLAVEGREAYLTCGCGVVFAVDCVGGNIRWAVRYERHGKPSQAMRNVYGVSNAMLELNGWDDDLVIPYGRSLLVMSSDSDKLMALDRRSGELLWESPRTSPFGSVANYCLGVHGRGLFVAGKNVVRRYDIISGRLLWEKEIDTSFGRGCLTEDAIYLPANDSILKLDLDKGELLGKVGVVLTSDEPVGNLFSDGEKLWAVGAGRVYAMTTLEQRLAMLDQQIAAGDGEAQLNRMRLHSRQNEMELAISDLRGAYDLFRAKLPPDDAARRLFDAIHELKLAHDQPLVVLQLLTERFVAAQSPPQLGKESILRRNDLIASAVSVIRQQKIAGAAPHLLAVAPLLGEEYLQTAAAYAVDVTATMDDVPHLVAALEQQSSATQLVAIRTAARLAPSDAKIPLSRLLAGRDDRVRLAAARALVNIGEQRDALRTLVSLLDSENVRVRARSHQSLQAVTGQQIAFAAEGKPEDRAAAAKVWRQWVETSGASANLTLPLSEQSVPLGRTLFVCHMQRTIHELDEEHEERWRMVLPGPAWGCQGLSNGHRLVAVYSHSLVIEYDDAGKEVWRKDRLPGPPYSVQRLENGNTLVACPDIQQVVEITPDGRTSATNIQGRPIFAHRLENGNTLVALQVTNRVVEVDPTGNIVWEARTSGRPSHAARLENGNTLVCLTNVRRVVEYDPTGKNIVWSSQAPLSNPSAAHRLTNGHTLVADYQGLHEIDASGKQVVWQHRPSVQSGRGGLPQLTGLSSF
jgi:outer membrane protein assembly factor BamB